MPPSFDNPFRKPPRSKKEAEDISSLVTGQERKGGENEKDSSRIELSTEEQEIIDNEPWTREQMDQWAKKYGLPDDWIDSKLQLKEDGTWTSTKHLVLNFVEDVKDFPKGIVRAHALSLNGLTSVDGLVLPKIHRLRMKNLRNPGTLILPEGIEIIAFDKLDTIGQLKFPTSVKEVLFTQLPQEESERLVKEYPNITFDF